MNPSAKTILIEILLKSNSLDSLFAKKINQKSQKTNAQLSNYAQERWESILNFIVSQNPEASVKNIGKNLAETLFYANLVKTYLYLLALRNLNRFKTANKYTYPIKLGLNFKQIISKT